MVDFAVSVARWVNKAKSRSDILFRAIASDALLRVKELTPVDTGYLRANFVDTLDPTSIDRPSANPIVGIELQKARAGDVIYILNPVIYARRIEYGFIGDDSAGRKFSYAGAGMVRQTIAELPEIAQKALKRVRGEEK